MDQYDTAGIDPIAHLVPHLQGDVDLFVFCMRGRISEGMVSIYQVFSPLALAVVVITGLEHEDSMESWWANGILYQQWNGFSRPRMCALNNGQTDSKRVRFRLGVPCALRNAQFKSMHVFVNFIGRNNRLIFLHARTRHQCLCHGFDGGNGSEVDELGAHVIEEPENNHLWIPRLLRIALQNHILFVFLPVDSSFSQSSRDTCSSIP